MQPIYPQPVLDKIQEVIKSLDETNFFILEDCTHQAAETVLGEFFMAQFMEGKPLGFSSDEEVKELLGFIMIESTFHSLQSKGLIDMIDDEYGNKIPFITKDGEDIVREVGTE